MSVVSESCPNKEPRRTSLYKNINSLVRAINHSSASTEALALMFDIYEYYTSVTKELSLKNESNSVHRKNIYYLINALEQKHGRKTNGN
jgi:hypothetical protein